MRIRFLFCVMCFLLFLCGFGGSWGVLSLCCCSSLCLIYHLPVMPPHYLRLLYSTLFFFFLLLALSVAGGLGCGCFLFLLLCVLGDKS
jgi:hypothetical protein